LLTATGAFDFIANPKNFDRSQTPMFDQRRSDARNFIFFAASELPAEKRATFVATGQRVRCPAEFAARIKLKQARKWLPSGTCDADLEVIA